MELDALAALRHSLNLEWSIQLAFWERDADMLLSRLEAMREPALDGQAHFTPRALYAAWAHQIRGADVAARDAFAEALTVIDSVAAERPDDYRIHAARGLALAGLGRGPEVLREADWLARSVIREDAMFGPLVAEMKGMMLAQAGYADAALDEVEQLLNGASRVSTYTFALDPRWDPLRPHPRFRELLSRAR